MPRAINDQPVTALDRAAAISAALVIVGLAVFLLVRNQPIADPRLFFVLRVVISFSAATLGAAIPGFLNVGWSGGGLAVRAGGALALFALTFVYAQSRDGLRALAATDRGDLGGAGQHISDPQPTAKRPLDKNLEG